VRYYINMLTSNDKRQYRPLLNLSVICALAPSLVPHATAQVRLEPRLEVRQVFGDSFAGTGGDDPGALTIIQPGLTLNINRPRIQTFVDFSYERRIPVETSITDRDRFNLAARASAQPIQDLFFIDAGGGISRQTLNSRGRITLNPDIDNNNQIDNYSFFISPRLERRFNSFLSGSAGYTLTGSFLDGQGRNQFLQTDNAIPGFGFGDVNSNQIAHSTFAQLTTGPGFSDIRATLRGGYDFSNRDSLDGRSRSYTVNLDLEYALNRRISLVGSIGYEDIRDTQNGIRVDPATGLTLVDANGRVLEDPINRALLFANKGVRFDAGLQLSPSRRTQISLRIGRREGDTVVNANASLRPFAGFSITGNYSESLQNDGRIITQSLAGQTVSQFGSRQQSIGIFPIIGINPVTGLPEVGQLASNSVSFFQRAGSLSFQLERRGYRATLAFFYDSRRPLNLLALPGQPPVDPALLNNRDNSFGGTFSLNRRLSSRASAEVGLNVRRSEFNLVQQQNDMIYGGSASFNYQLYEKINISANFFQSFQNQRVPGQTALRRNFADTTFSIGLTASF
jgi:uncharacterized protein (PEP-CTERM system associated)